VVGLATVLLPRGLVRGRLMQRGWSGAPLLARAAAVAALPYAARLSIASFLAVDQRSILALLRRSRTVIVETVERDFLNRAALHIDQSLLTPRFLDTLGAELGPPP